MAMVYRNKDHLLSGGTKGLNYNVQETTASVYDKLLYGGFNTKITTYDYQFNSQSTYFGKTGLSAYGFYLIQWAQGQTITN